MGGPPLSLSARARAARAAVVEVRGARIVGWYLRIALLLWLADARVTAPASLSPSGFSVLLNRAHTDGRRKQANEWLCGRECSVCAAWTERKRKRCRACPPCTAAHGGTGGGTGCPCTTHSETTVCELPSCWQVRSPVQLCTCRFAPLNGPAGLGHSWSGSRRNQEKDILPLAGALSMKLPAMHTWLDAVYDPLPGLHQRVGLGLVAGTPSPEQVVEL